MKSILKHCTGWINVILVGAHSFSFVWICLHWARLDAYFCHAGPCTWSLGRICGYWSFWLSMVSDNPKPKLVLMAPFSIVDRQLWVILGIGINHNLLGLSMTWHDMVLSSIAGKDWYLPTRLSACKYNLRKGNHIWPLHMFLNFYSVDPRKRSSRNKHGNVRTSCQPLQTRNTSWTTRTRKRTGY